MCEGLYTAEISVVGVGNIILTDEGFGVHVVNQLKQKYRFPDNVQLIDGGTLGVELTQFITGTQRLLIIDSIDGDNAPGTIYHLTGDNIRAHFKQKISAHEVGIEEVLTILDLTGKTIPEVVVIGAQPHDLNAGVGLSPQMNELVPQIIDQALEILHAWNVNPIRIDPKYQ